MRFVVGGFLGFGIVLGFFGRFRLVGLIVGIVIGFLDLGFLLKSKKYICKIGFFELFLPFLAGIGAG